MIEVNICSVLYNQNFPFTVVQALKDLTKATHKKPSGWRERMEAREENWECSREKLFEETLISSALPECAVSLFDNLNNGLAFNLTLLLTETTL